MVKNETGFSLECTGSNGRIYDNSFKMNIILIKF
jgi:hypothetical protein